MSILQSLAICRLAQSYRLRTDTQAGSVHQRHNILDKAHLPIANQLGRGIRKDQLTCGRALDTEFILDATHLHAAIALIINEHRQSARIGCTLLCAGQHQRHIAVTIGNKTLHTIQKPCSTLLRPCCLQLHSSQIRTCIGLGEVHSAGSSLTYPCQVFHLLLLRGKLVQCLGTILQAPDILEARIGTRNHLVRHNEAGKREVQTAKSARQRKAIQSGLIHSLHIFNRARSILHSIIHYPGALLINTLGIGRNHITTYSARNLHYATIIIHSILKVMRRIVIERCFRESTLLQFHNLLHHRMREVVLQIFII